MRRALVSVAVGSNFYRGVFCGLAATLIWGAFPVMTRFGIQQSSLDFYDITFLRFATAGLILLPYLLVKGMQNIGLGQALILMTGIGAPYILVVVLGLTYLPVRSFSVTTPGSMIIFSVLLGYFILGTRISKQQCLGILLILGGILLTGFEVVGALPQGQASYSYVFVIAGFMWACYTVFSRKFSVESFHATAIVSVFSMLLYVPVYFYIKGDQIFAVGVNDILVHSFYQGILLSIIALYLFSKAIFYLGAEAGASLSALVPGIGILLGSLLLDETTPPLALTGLVAVTAGLLVTLVAIKKS